MLNTCVAGEGLGVDVEMFNPLQVRCAPLRWWPSARRILVSQRWPRWLHSGTCCILSLQRPGSRLLFPFRRHPQIELRLTEVRAVCEFEAAGGASPSDNGAAVAAPGGVDVVDQAVVLLGGERVRLRLALRPLVPGTLTVRGLQWVLNGTAVGRRFFALKRAKQRKGAPPAVRQAEVPSSWAYLCAREIFMTAGGAGGQGLQLAYT